MKKKVYEQSIQNARVDLNLVNNRVKFDYPTRKLKKSKEMTQIFTAIFLPYFLLLIAAELIWWYFTTDWTLLQTANMEIDISIAWAMLIESFSWMFIKLVSIPLGVSFIATHWKRSLLRFYPKIGHFYAKNFFSRFYVARFENIKTTKVEIPLFENVILNYKATGDYAKQLKRIKITEHPFMMVVTDRNGTMVEPNEYLWKAEITFKKIPKNGRIDIYFI